MLSGVNMASKAVLAVVWSRNLKNIRTITHADIARIAHAHTKTPTNSIQKGYKFFWDSYVHDVEGEKLKLISSILTAFWWPCLQWQWRGVPLIIQFTHRLSSVPTIAVGIHWSGIIIV